MNLCRNYIQHIGQSTNVQGRSQDTADARAQHGHTQDPPSFPSLAVWKCTVTKLATNAYSQRLFWLIDHSHMNVPITVFLFDRNIDFISALPNSWM